MNGQFTCCTCVRVCVWIEYMTSEALFHKVSLFSHSALKPELAEKLRMLINIHGPIAPKPRPTPLTMPGLGIPPGSTPTVSDVIQYRLVSSHSQVMAMRPENEITHP